MAFQSHRERFTGKLSGISTDELKKLDYSLSTVDERMAFINNKYKKVSAFYNSYTFCKEKNLDDMHSLELSEEDYRKYYKYNLNNKDSLSMDINIFKFCENDGSYILNSTDIPRARQQEYRILSEEEFRKILDKEACLNSISKKMDIDSQEEVLDILESSSKNIYLDVKEKISKKDILDPKCGEVLFEYSVLKAHLKDELRKLKEKEKSYLDLNKIRRTLKSVNDDMILSKIQLKGIRNHAKRLGDEKSKLDLSVINYENPKHIEAIIVNIPFGDIKFDNDLTILTHDLKAAINKLRANGTLSNLDGAIIHLKNKGFNNVEIGRKLKRSEAAIRQRFKRICKVISNTL